jgi:hypothetical protein
MALVRVPDLRDVVLGEVARPESEGMEGMLLSMSIGGHESVFP